MSRHFTCPHGHQWELAETTSSLAAHLDPLCPVCGAPGVSSAIDGGQADRPAAVKLALGPAAVGGTAGVPPPLPTRAAPAPAVTPTAPPRPMPVPRRTPVHLAPPDPVPRRPSRVPVLVIGALVLATVVLAVLLAVAVHNGRQAVQAWRDETGQRDQAERRVQEALQARAQEVLSRSQAKREAQDAALARDEALTQRDLARRDAQRADQARQEAERLRKDDVEARARAEAAARLAEQARQGDQKQRLLAEARLGRLYAGTGLRLMQNGDYPESLLWLTEALRLTPGGADQERPQRMRLAAVLSQCPRPLQMWFHDQPVMHAVTSPDGRLVFTSDRSGTAWLWDTASGKSVGEAMKHGALVATVVFSRDGRKLLTTEVGGTIHLWDAATGKPALRPLVLDVFVSATSFSADSRRIFAVTSPIQSPQCHVEVRDATTGELVGEPWDLGEKVDGAVFGAEGRLLLTRNGKTARLWDTSTQKPVGAVLEHRGNIIRATFSANGLRLFTASMDHAAQIWEVPSGKPVGPVLSHPDMIVRGAFHQDGRLLATACVDGVARVWDVTTGQRVGPDLRHRGVVNWVSISPDGRHLLTASLDGLARLWETRTGEEVMPALRLGGLVSRVGFTPDGVRILIASGQTVRLWDLTAGEPLRFAADDPSPGRTVVSSNGRREVRLHGAEAQLYDIATGKTIGPVLRHKHDITLAAFSADGRRLLTVSQKASADEPEAEVRTWDAATGEAIGPAIESLSPIQRAVLSPDGSRAVTANAINQVMIWDVATGKQMGVAMDHRDTVTHLLFTPDGRNLLTATDGGSLRFWDPARGEPASPPMKHGDHLTDILLSVDGKRLLTASTEGTEGTAQVWDTATGDPVGKLMRGTSHIFHVTLSVDNRRVATSEAGGVVRVWDAATGTPITPLLEHGAGVSRLALSPDGRWLATASGNRVRLWDARTGDLLSPPLRHASGRATITGLEFTPDGKLVTSHGQPGDPRTRHVWDFPAETRSVEELRRLALLLTGSRLDDTGGLVPGDLADLRAAWQARSPREFTQAPERLAAWHRRGAAECEQQKQWSGVVGHLTALLDRAGDSSDLRARRGRAFAELTRWDEAAADYRKAMQGEPGRADLHAALGQALVELRRWDEAIASYRKAIQLQGDDRDVHAALGRALAEQGKYAEAGAAFSQAIRLGRNEAGTYSQQALLCLAAGDQDGYRRACRHLARRFATSEDAAAAGVALWACTLAPDAIPDLKALLPRAEALVKDRPNDHAARRALAALLYRTGSFEAAVQRLAEAVKVPGEAAPAEALFLAMAHQRLGHSEEAQKWLEKAGQTAERDKHAGWDRRLEVQLLRREAEALVKGGKPN